MRSSLAQVRIRRAALADIPQLSALLGRLFAQEADFTPEPVRQVRGLRMLLKQPALGRIYCATEQQAVVGMVSILFTVSTAEGGRAAWLEDMIVHPERRGQGVGERLLQEAIRRARAAGCTRLTLLTDASNHSAMRFYRRAGFVRSQMVPFRLSL